MLLIKNIEKNKDDIIKRLSKRGKDWSSDIYEVISLNNKRKEIQFELDNNLEKINKLSKQIGELFKQGKQEEATALKGLTTDIKNLSKQLSEKLEANQEKIHQLLYTIPNAPHHSVPSGNSEEDNELILEKGEIPILNNQALPHWELASKYDLIDFELGTKITGAGFPLYKNKGAKLQRALISYFLDKNIEAGYTEFQPPLLVNEASAYGTGQLPDKEGQMYYIQQDNLYLIPTSEVPITNIFRNDLLSKEMFPIKCTCYTPCFRREAGSYGSHVRGLNRLHQFDKVEIVRVEQPENSYKALDEMVKHVQNILEELELPYRILRLCGGDLGFASALTYDFEVYSAAQKKWLEVSSVSNFETFQSNRLKIRFKNSDNKNKLVHTLNGSSLALPRILATLLENNQREEEIKIPKKLIPYTNFNKI